MSTVEARPKLEVVQDGWHQGDSVETLLTREWLVTNGLGGYASGTIAGVSTRRYHGYLIAALPAPLGRTVMLNHLDDQLVLHDGHSLRLGGDEHYSGELLFPGPDILESFRLECGTPVWTFRNGGYVLEKRLVMPYLQNTMYICYTLIEGPDEVTLRLAPAVSFRPHEQAVSDTLPSDCSISGRDRRWEVHAGKGIPPLHLQLDASEVRFDQHSSIHPRHVYRIEKSRGYESEGRLWMPGCWEVKLSPGRTATLVASAESWDAIGALTPSEAFAAELSRRQQLLELADQRTRKSDVAKQLVLAADQFIITPHTRVRDIARIHAAGDQPHTVIAGYHWFTDWGRDTMISLEGLTLTTGRFREAGSILRTFGMYVRDGLIPNMFPEGEHDGLYHTADATLWFFHAIDRYTMLTGERETLRCLLPKLVDIIEHHMRGTRFGIHVDPRDGLLSQGADGYQLTWMDAKVDGWVVTPRRGKAVEINALFYNALRLMERWTREEGDPQASQRMHDAAERLCESFNRRFWNADLGCLYDVVDGEHGDDPKIRPNQILAISLTHPVLQRTRWDAVVEVVSRSLVTPVGLRSLAPGDPDYKSHYFGDLRTRDAAYHQGTVWAWLIGPFIDALVKLHRGDKQRARTLLEGFVPELRDAGIGTISEIFDAEPPYTPRGCIAQAWSVAEVLRCWTATEE